MLSPGYSRDALRSGSHNRRDTMAFGAKSPADIEASHQSFAVKSIIQAPKRMSASPLTHEPASSQSIEREGPREQQLQEQTLFAMPPAGPPTMKSIGFKSFSFSPSLIITKNGILQSYPSLPSSPGYPFAPSPFVSFGGSWRRNKAAQPFPTLPTLPQITQLEPQEPGNHTSDELKATWSELVGNLMVSNSSEVFEDPIDELDPLQLLEGGLEDQTGLPPLVIVKSGAARHDPRGGLFEGSSLFSSPPSPSPLIRDFNPTLTVNGSSSITYLPHTTHVGSKKEGMDKSRPPAQKSLQREIKSCRLPSELVHLLKSSEMDATNLSTLLDHYASLVSRNLHNPGFSLSHEDHRAFLHEACLRLAPLARNDLSPRGVRCALWSLVTLNVLDLARRHDASTLASESVEKQGQAKQGRRKRPSRSKDIDPKLTAHKSFLDEIERDEMQDAFSGAR